ncbi:SigE family RNA polymerase sigma factor [Nocardioides iriomotensis]|uniref:SigE family RNA polymerase sigma factor n=1 Tax=Nocardioides iriomotensis TaxID=715784 RepID=A0A4Q5JA87_9ACTN|nr:SigE family RNA polymerase sigma factor [Nocardioides iriomotensis]RYU14811.1 SigE family RNA polymerase sigma factor [Nocardioides iriomotensis]
MRRNEAEFAAFVAARRPHLRRVAYALCGDWHQAEDLVQTALAKLYVAWPRIHKAGAEEAYARQVIVRANIDESRRPWRRERACAEQHDRPVAADISVEDRSELVAALQQLTPMQRRAVVLRHWLDLSVEQTAAELGVSTGTVKAHTSRGLANLHSALNVDASALRRTR